MSADAIATLQNRGFKTRTQQKPDSTVPPDHVIDTDPAANCLGERRRRDHHQRLHRARAARGARRLHSCPTPTRCKSSRPPGSASSSRANSPSTPELKDKVIGTNPPANQTSAITNEITVIVGSGPGDRSGARRCGPDGGRRAAEPHGRTASPRSPSPRSTAPGRAGRCIGTNPPSGPDRSARHGHRVAGVARQPVRDAGPARVSSGRTPSRNLRALGWTGVLIKGADVAEQRSAHATRW